MPAAGSGVGYCTMPRAQNRVAKGSTLLRRRSTLPIYCTVVILFIYDTMQPTNEPESQQISVNRNTHNSSIFRFTFTFSQYNPLYLHITLFKGEKTLPQPPPRLGACDRLCLSVFLNVKMMDFHDLIFEIYTIRKYNCSMFIGISLAGPIH